MKKITLLILLISNILFSQIRFEKGYIINNENKKIDCYIKNIDWLNNPEEFIYKLHESDAERTANPESVIEFGIQNEFKFISKTVKIDKSSQKLSDINNENDPIFIEERLFLKTLIEGKANLYMFAKKNATIYFYNISDKEIVQLFFKEYNIGNSIKKNETFKKQLFTDLKCASIKIPFINKMEYSKKDLIKIFTDYNQCNNENFIDFTKINKKKLEFNFSLRPRISHSSISVINSLIKSSSIYFEDATSFGIGIESELIFPFNKNKWSLIFEPTYQKTSSNGIRNNNTEYNLEYSSIEIPVGIRHYFFLNKNSKLFLNGSIYFDANFNSGIFDAKSGYRLLEVNSGIFAGFGTGYKFKDIYSIEIRYFSNKDILTDYVLYASDFSTISLILGFTLF